MAAGPGHRADPGGQCGAQHGSRPDWCCGGHVACDSSGGSYEVKNGSFEAEPGWCRARSSARPFCRRSCPAEIGATQISVCTLPSPARGRPPDQRGIWPGCGSIWHCSKNKSRVRSQAPDQLARRTRWGFSADDTTLPPFPRLRPPQNRRYRKNSFGFWTLRYSSTSSDRGLL